MPALAAAAAKKHIDLNAERSSKSLDDYHRRRRRNARVFR
jgi:hypothetical protein